MRGLRGTVDVVEENLKLEDGESGVLNHVDEYSSKINHIISSSKIEDLSRIQKLDVLADDYTSGSLSEKIKEPWFQETLNNFYSQSDKVDDKFHISEKISWDIRYLVSDSHCNDLIASFSYFNIDGEKLKKDIIKWDFKIVYSFYSEVGKNLLAFKNSPEQLRNELVSFYSFFRLFHSLLAVTMKLVKKQDSFGKFYEKTVHLLSTLSNIDLDILDDRDDKTLFIEEWLNEYFDFLCASFKSSFSHERTFDYTKNKDELSLYRDFLKEDIEEWSEDKKINDLVLTHLITLWSDPQAVNYKQYERRLLNVDYVRQTHLAEVDLSYYKALHFTSSFNKDEDLPWLVNALDLLIKDYSINYRNGKDFDSITDLVRDFLDSYWENATSSEEEMTYEVMSALPLVYEIFSMGSHFKDYLSEDENELDELNDELKEFLFMFKWKIVTDTKKTLNRDALALTNKLHEALNNSKERELVDSLTLAWNRKAYNEEIATLMAKNERKDADFSIVMLDIDYFKKINDTFGHFTWDEVLKFIVDYIKNFVRKTDKVFRLWWEEFAVTLPDTWEEWAVRLAAKLREGIADSENPLTLKGLLDNSIPKLDLTCSMWVKQYQKGLSSDELYKNTDEALYKAKRNWRNRVEIA